MYTILPVLGITGVGEAPLIANYQILFMCYYCTVMHLSIYDLVFFIEAQVTAPGLQLHIRNFYNIRIITPFNYCTVSKKVCLIQTLRS